MPGIKLAFALAATAYASGKYLFGGKNNSPPRDSSTLAAAAYAIGNYFFGGKDDDPPPRDSYSASTFAAAVYTIGKRLFGGKDDDPRDSYSASTFAAAAHAIGKRFFGRKDDDPPLRDSYSATLAAATHAIGNYFFGRNDNGPPYPPPPRDSYSTSFYDSGTTRTQTQRSYRSPPQSPSYTHRPPPTYSHSQTAPWTSASPNYSRDVHHTGTPSQTHLSSTPSGALAVVEDLEFAKKLREKARRRGQEMAEAYSQANSAQRIGDYWGAQEYRQQGDAHKSAMEELDERAAKIIFRENNKDRKNGGKIDLHGLFVAEAVGFANQLLQYGESRGDQVMCFIVGESFDKPYRMCA